MAYSKQRANRFAIETVATWIYLQRLLGLGRKSLCQQVSDMNLLLSCRDKRKKGVSARFQKLLQKKGPKADRSVSGGEGEQQYQQQARVTSKAKARATSPLAGILLNRGMACCQFAGSGAGHVWPACGPDQQSA